MEKIIVVESAFEKVKYSPTTQTASGSARLCASSAPMGHQERLLCEMGYYASKMAASIGHHMCTLVLIFTLELLSSLRTMRSDSRCFLQSAATMKNSSRRAKSSTGHSDAMSTSQRRTSRAERCALRQFWSLMRLCPIRWLICFLSFQWRTRIESLSEKGC